MSGVDPSWRGFQFLEEDQILGLEHSGLEFHAVLQQPCRFFMLRWFGYYSKM